MEEIVDMPTIDVDSIIKKRDENLLFNSGVINTEDEKLSISRYGSNPIGYLGVNPSNDCTNFYNSFESIISGLTETITSGLKTVFNLYQAFIKFKSVDSVKYSKIIETYFKGSKSNVWTAMDDYNRISVTKDNLNKLKENDNTNNIINSVEDNFRLFCHMFKHNVKDCDLSFALSRDEYIEEISKIRMNLLNLFESNNYLKMDLENSAVHYHSNELGYSNNIVFKVRPYLNKVIRSQINDSIPSCSYKVLIDFKSIVEFIINSPYFKLPDEYDISQGTTIDLETYVSKELLHIGNLPELIAKRILLELCDVSHNIKGNWCHFIKRFENTHDTCRANDTIRNISNKLNYLLRLRSQDTSISSIDVTMTKVFDYINNHDYTIDTPFLYRLQNATNPDWNDKENDAYLRMGAVMFSKAFEHYFEDSVLLDIDNIKDIWRSTKYCREFNRKYDLNELFYYVNSINDYNIRDFFSSYLKSLKLKNFTYDERKLESGENYSFMYSKLIRKYTLYTTALLFIIGELFNKYKTIEFDRDSKLDLRIIQDLKELMHDTFCMIGSISNESGIILSGFGGEYSSKISNEIKRISQYCKRFTGINNFPSYNSDTSSEFQKLYNNYADKEIIRGNDKNGYRTVRPVDLLDPIYLYDSVNLAGTYNDKNATTDTSVVVFKNIINSLTLNGNDISECCYY